MNVELYIFNALHSLVGRFGALDWLVVFTGKYLPYLAAAVVVWLVFQEKNWRDRIYYGSFLVLAAILSRALITEIIRLFYFRSRPFAEIGFEPLISHAATAGFPSGHAALYFALAFALFFFSRTWGSVFTALALAVGAARVIAGVHWPLDIAAGILVALISVFVVKWLLAPSGRG